MLEEANKESELAVRLDGADSRCLSIRGMLLLANRDFDGTLETLQRALQLTPDDPWLTQIMAYYLIFTGQGNDALDWLRKSASANPVFLPPTHRQAVGMACMVGRKYDDAVRSFAAISSPDYYVHVYAAGCLAKLGRLDEARTQSRLASDLNPVWPPIQDWCSEFKGVEDKEHIGELVRMAINALRDGPKIAGGQNR